MRGGSISRSGGSDGGMYSVNAPNDVNRVVVNSQDQIEKERQYSKLHQALQAQFEEADLNGDGRLRKDELIAFLMKKSGADESTFDEAEKQMHLERYEWIAGILF